MCLEKHLIVVHLTKSKLKKRTGVNDFILTLQWSVLAGKGLRAWDCPKPSYRGVAVPILFNACWKREKLRVYKFISFTCMLARFPLPVAVESEGLNGCPNFPEKNIEFWRSNMEPSSQSQRWCPLIWKKTWIVWWSQRKFDGYWCQQFHN